jgi:hypothetical protein
MSFSVAPLLLHSADLPPHAREALAAALSASPEQRKAHLLRAARVMHRELALDCADVRELIGLPPGAC